MGVAEGVDPTDLASTGWGVMFPNDVDPDVFEALRPLLDHRREEAARLNPSYYREFRGTQGVRPDDNKRDVLKRLGVSPGSPAEPDRLPYYLLLVGDPEAISFRLQWQLGVEYAVGRVAFDTPADYRRYAENVVAAETSLDRRRRVASFISVTHPGDLTSARAARQLSIPLGASLAKDYPDWAVQTVSGGQATKAELDQVLNARERLLVVVSAHGVAFRRDGAAFKRDAARQRNDQGALLCADWPGRGGEDRPVPPESYFSGSDVRDAVGRGPQVVVLLASYSAGTPRRDEFATQILEWPVDLASRPFVARLPQRLMARAGSGTLAVIGLIDRWWVPSPRATSSPQADAPQIGNFRAALRRIMGGMPVGRATKYIGEAYAGLSVHLNSELEAVSLGKLPDHELIEWVWPWLNNVRGCVLLGDPAVRL
jgi:hypothetical protein